jgi:hypothetical protein
VVVLVRRGTPTEWVVCATLPLAYTAAAALRCAARKHSTHGTRASSRMLRTHPGAVNLQLRLLPPVEHL